MKAFETTRNTMNEIIYDVGYSDPRSVSSDIRDNHGNVVIGKSGYVQ